MSGLILDILRRKSLSTSSLFLYLFSMCTKVENARSHMYVVEKRDCASERQRSGRHVVRGLGSNPGPTSSFFERFRLLTI